MRLTLLLLCLLTVTGLAQTPAEWTLRFRTGVAAGVTEGYDVAYQIVRRPQGATLEGVLRSPESNPRRYAVQRVNLPLARADEIYAGVTQRGILPYLAGSRPPRPLQLIGPTPLPPARVADPGRAELLAYLLGLPEVKGMNLTVGQKTATGASLRKLLPAWVYENW